jgi:uncharacterized membrane protein YqgA involved in biofilm formation
MEDFVLWGSILNALGVALGALVGVAIRAFGRIKKTAPAPDAPAKDKLSDTVFHGLGLCVVLVGMGGMLQGMVNDRIADAFPSLSLSGESTLVIILSVVLGSVVGHLLDLDLRINQLGAWVEKQTKGKMGNVAQGFVSASLLFCVGSMAIVGSLNSGLTGDHSMLYTKTLLDTVSAIVFASTMGIGVAFSGALILLYQGSIALAAGWIAPLLSPDVIMTMSITGSLLIMALGFHMLGILRIKVMNYVPAVFFPIALVPLWELLAL